MTPPSPSRLPEVYPPVPAVEAGVREFLVRADRSAWSPYDLVSADQLACVSPERLTDAQVLAVRTALLVEDHLPGYLAEYIRILNAPDAADPQAAANRQVLRFAFRWAAEEDRHSHALELYLTGTGLVPRPELDAESARARRTPYHFGYETLSDSFVYLALQERATHLYYRALAEAVEEPVLREVLGRMAGDEARHARFFYDLLTRVHAADLTALAARVTAVARDFRMPLQANLDGYRRHVLNLFRAAPAYRHEAALAHLSQAIDRAAKGDRAASRDLAANPEAPS
jgi:acyl-[acyl-carrier-protein] desaturase